MTANMSECQYNDTVWNQRLDKMYTYFYLLLLIPGLLLNTIALWVLCRHISKKTKAVIFMINLAFADLAHILSLPLRVYYYFTHTWPFGRGVCLFCFYLKYLNMYAAIVFLMCISMQRCIFLQKPFTARRWRRRYDLLISFVVWVTVGLACSPFILMRSSSGEPNATSTQPPSGVTNQHLTPSKLSSNSSDTSVGCFKDLPMRHTSLSLTIPMVVFAEACGFLIPLACIAYSTLRISWSLKESQTHDQNSLNSSARSRLHSVTSNSQTEKFNEKQTSGEKRRALRMVLSCFALFLFCFAPYHLNFALYMMVRQEIVTNCEVRKAVLQFHPVSLCIAGLSCCVNPILYYFLTTEFRMHLKRRTSSFSSSLSSPTTSPTQCPMQSRLMSTSSYRE
ncbi:putative P2Y purinoceptor 10 [Archocentrus centrarchus]|uniref:putative P2Y purinoceptor 10 n=1 Tax=Archocentrus centrarchus TaxID=63155 RepID=UPI0011EA0D9D|nr:putative P2Y purinoceptor 10 [Archocentrus centrarchus]XP_030594513.1 putative P2Y purinoceptor 10 [Archocentrus centrarchus]